MKLKIKNHKSVVSIVLTICMIFGLVSLSSSEPKELLKPQILVDNPPQISPQNPKVGDDIEITYTLRPQPFQHDISKPKEIVLVLDKSGSMEECEEHQIKNHKSCSSPTKIASLKSASISFIKQMSEKVDNLKISIVTYETKATIIKELTDVSTGKQDLIKTINSILANGGTNSGGGLRKAGHILKNLGNPSANKSIVFMSDGEPTAYTTRKGKYYYTLDNNDMTSNGGYESDKREGINYAYGVADVIKTELNNSNIFTIGYGMTTDENKVMKNIHNKMGGVDENFHETSDSIDSIFDKIADDIIAQYKIEDQKLNLQLDQSVTMMSDISYGEIIYKRGNDGWYRADSVQIKFKIKCNRKGEIKIVNQGSKFEYKDIFGNKVYVDIPEYSIYIGSNSKVTIDVSDSSGKINDTYDSSQNVGKRYDKVIQNDFNQDYKLYGDSYANIKFSGDKIDYLQYQFIQSNEKPNELPSSGWKEIYDGSGIPEDVDINKPGFLTQKSYDVSHMPLISSEQKWNDKKEVFKTPFDESKYKPAITSNSGSEYLKKEEYIDKDGKKQFRWVSNTIFTNEINMTGTDYKEANKTWGYLKVPKTGYYTFQTKSDDGLYAILTIDKNTQFTIVNNFKVHGTETDKSNTVKLEEGKYYPIYMEYFNWGGRGCYSLAYSYSENSNPSSNSQVFKEVNSNLFYPSKNKAPGESGDNIFTGVAGVKLPEEVGKYYIAYKAGIKPENIDKFEPYKSGVYGPFGIDERFTLSRTIEENTSSDNSYEYILKYTLQPNPIRVTDIYKTKQQLVGIIKDSLLIDELKLKDKIPEKIEVSKGYISQGSTHGFNPTINKDINGLSTIEGYITGNINYQLQRNNDFKESIYTSRPIVINVGLTSDEVGEFVFKDKEGSIIYKDVSLNDTRVNKEQRFSETRFNIGSPNQINKHGIFNKKGSTFTILENNKTVNEQMVIKKMYYTIGIDIDIKKDNSILEIKIPEGVSESVNNIRESINVYTVEGNIITGMANHNTEINGNIIKVSKFEKNKKYIITYVTGFTSSNVDIIAKLDKKEKIFRAIIKTEEGGSNADLPELF